MSKVTMIVAVDSEWGFGKEGKIPWFVKEDLKHFQKTTKDGICLMGRLTYEDIRERIKSSPLLKSRISLVFSRSDNFMPIGAACSRIGFKETIQYCKDKYPEKNIHLIGGESIYKEGIEHADEIYISFIGGSYGCDVTFPHERLFELYEEVDKEEFYEHDFSIVKFIRRT